MPESTRRRQEDEDRIVTLLDSIHALPPGPDVRRKDLENEMFTLVDSHFREALKPSLVAKFGAAAGERGAARYTAMMNDFFVKVLAKRPDAFWRAKSATELRKWASVVDSNQIRDYLRREKRYQNAADALAPLVEEREGFFKQKTGMNFDSEILERIDALCRETDPSQRMRGWVLRHRFVDAMTRDQIADQLNVSVHAVRKALDEGVLALRTATAD